MRPTIATGLFLLATATTAVASTPDKGTVSKDAPSVKWEGNAPGYGVYPASFASTSTGNEPVPCEAPYCDTFALTVADKADLNVIAQSRTEGQFVELRIVKPDGETVYGQSAAGEPVRIRVKQAAPGDYTVGVITNDPAAAGDYDASAALSVPAPAPAPAGPPAPGGGGEPQPQPQPAPAPSPAPSSEAPAASLGLKTKSVSAKKKRFKLALSSTKPVTGVKASLRKGKKVVARGSLKSLNGKGSITIKLKRKLKPGTYQLAVTASDGGRIVGLTTKLKVKK